MKHFLAILIFSTTLLHAKSINTKNSTKKYIFENNCMACHKQLSFNLKQIYFDYLLKYSSENAVKLALIDYLKKPNKDTSIMTKEYIRRFGLKKPTILSDKDLKKAIDYYWNIYKVFGKLK